MSTLAAIAALPIGVSCGDSTLGSSTSASSSPAASANSATSTTPILGNLSITGGSVPIGDTRIVITYPVTIPIQGAGDLIQKTFTDPTVRRDVASACFDYGRNAVDYFLRAGVDATHAIAELIPTLKSTTGQANVTSEPTANFDPANCKPR